MIDALAWWFKHNRWTWATTSGSMVPTAQDIEQALDRAAELLYAEPVGSQLEVGRLIIKKKHRGYDVYVFAGPYT